jgi:hypothetical protein
MYVRLKPSAVNPHVPLWKLEIDDITMTELVQLLKTHCKLVLEHSQSQTSPERRSAIKAEIKALRARRDCLIADFENAARVASGNATTHLIEG